MIALIFSIMFFLYCANLLAKRDRQHENYKFQGVVSILKNSNKRVVLLRWEQGTRVVYSEAYCPTGQRIGFHTLVDKSEVQLVNHLDKYPPGTPKAIVPLTLKEQLSLKILVVA
jgi:hypothetical protein